MNKTTFIGAGSFGTSLAILLGNKNITVSLWDRDIDVVNEINNKRTNEKYIKDLKIPEKVTAYNNIDEALKDSKFIVLAVPSHVIRLVARSLKGKIEQDAIIINIAKGIEEGTNKRLSEIIEDELSGHNVVVLSGPSHAEEVAQSIPTTLVASSRDMVSAEKVQDLFMDKNFRIYTNDDVIGVEIGGAVKNIIALAAGISDGIGYGDNSKAALMTRGMYEITKVGMALGGKAETFYGLTGMGDLIVTCTSMHSRNRRAGILIGQGKTLDEAVEEVGMVVEGVKACRAFHELQKTVDVSMPITELLYEILFGGVPAKDAVNHLMERDKKSE
ncbi:NAD(P)H-dependent glycerol-3-phosphate dehydrogenase [uncultured Clostridium sp.]|uniref:NAD(P)H-dependent glycerol-3-phosphate dehydrogenase n=1 Tax=uncultured Clostridium sp. TaxID=59620 RepID=UPI002639C21E|nr:NAD(P)H-dependent glycerol-3-phosphate dehydrogenase [uncultured Clostridium sp.]